MRHIIVYFAVCLCFITSCVYANPADGAGGGAYSSSEGTYIGSFGQFNNAIGGAWEQTEAYGYIEWRGRFHYGVDIGADIGTPLKALGTGIVREEGSGYDPYGYGCIITIHYPWAVPPDGSDVGMDVMYAHLSGTCVTEGSIVSKDQIIAYVGNSGSSTGPHTHMEVTYGNSDQRVDPALYFSDLSFGSGAGNSGGAGGKFEERVPPAVPFELKVDLVKPVRDIFEAIVKAATTGLKLIEGGMKNIFIILLTIDLALALIFYNIDKSMNEKTPFFAYLCYKFLLYGFLLFLLTHWGDFVGNLSKNLFSTAGAIMSNHTPEEVAAAISSPTDIIQKGLHIISPIFSQLMSDTSEILGIGTGIAALLAFIIMLLFLVIGWQVAKSYIEFYMMVLFGFTTFVFSGEKHTRIHAENGINGIIACSINLMFFCFFAITLQGMMSNLAMDSVFTVGSRTGQTITYKHPVADDQNNAGIPPGPEGLQQFMAKLRMVETGGSTDPYHTWSFDHNDDGSPNAYGAYQIQPENWVAWAEEAYAAGCPLLPDGGGYPTDGNRGYSQFSWSPMNQDIVASYKMLEYWNTYGNWHDVAVAWNGGGGAVGKGWSSTEEYWAKLSGAVPSEAANTAVGRAAINMFVLLKLLLLVLMFIVIGDKISQAVMNSFGSRGFTFRTNS